MPNATERSCMKNPEKHPFDLVVKRFLIILTKPQWAEKWREQKDTNRENYSFKMFGSENSERDTSIVGGKKDIKFKIFLLLLI